MKTILIISLSLGLANLAWGAGFEVDTHAARATGMATAVVAHIDDASAVLYNAAGILHNDGLDLMVGDTVILPSVTYSPTTGSSTGSTTGPVPPPHAYLTYGVNKNFAFGIGVYSLFGLATDWPSTWSGRYLTTNGQLATYYINPGFAARIGDYVKVGAGVAAVRGVVDLKRSLGFVESDGSVELAGSGWAGTANFGLQVEIVPKMLSFGFSYRSQTRLNFSGNAHFAGAPAELANTLKDQGITSGVTLPDNISLGLALKPMDSLTVAFDAVWTNWSTFQNLPIVFQDTSLNQTLQKNWKSGFNYHLGAEYSITESFRIRAGFLYDASPSPPQTLSPDLPDANRINIALGAGYHTGGFGVDVGYQFVLLMSTNSTYPGFSGSYSGNAQVIGLSLSYRN